MKDRKPKPLFCSPRLALTTHRTQPEEHKNSEITQLFDFEFTSLPNFIYERQKFESGVEELASRYRIGCAAVATVGPQCVAYPQR